MKIRSVGAELLDANGRTDGQTDMTKLILAFLNFANARNENKTVNKKTLFVNVADDIKYEND